MLWFKYLLTHEWKKIHTNLDDLIDLKSPLPCSHDLGRQHLHLIIMFKNEDKLLNFKNKQKL